MAAALRFFKVQGLTNGGRAHRLVVVAHPLPQKFDPKETS
jgi:hypothetical protein